MFFRRAKAIPRSQELVFLDADDDLGTIRSKLESSSAEEIFLAIPRRSSVLRSLRTLRHLMLGPGQRAPRFVVPDWVPLPSLASFLSLLGLLSVAAVALLV